MPDIRHKGTRQAIAKAFLGNGRNQAKALLEADYSYNYAYNGKGAKLFDRRDLQAAIDTAEDEINRKTDVTHAEIIARLRLYSGLDEAKESDNLKPITSGDQLKSLELLGKSKAMFKDKVITEDAADSPTPEEADAISEEKRLSVANKPKLVERTG